jgi:hypothetical protein
LFIKRTLDGSNGIEKQWQQPSAFAFGLLFVLFVRQFSRKGDEQGREKIEEYSGLPIRLKVEQSSI